MVNLANITEDVVIAAKYINFPNNDIAAYSALNEGLMSIRSIVYGEVRSRNEIVINGDLSLSFH